MSEFDPRTRVKQIRRGAGSFQYLQVNDRVIWFRGENEAGLVDTELVQWDPDRGVAVVKATVTIPSKGTATGLGSSCRADLQAKAEKKSVQPDQIESYVEFAETAAIGRALGRLGYGTDDALSEDGPVDNPREIREAQPPANRPPAQPSASARPPAHASAQGRTAPATDGATGLTRAVGASTHETAPAQASGDPLQQAKARVKALAHEWGWGLPELEAVFAAHVIAGVALGQASRAQMEALEAVMRDRGVAALPSLAAVGTP